MDITRTACWRMHLEAVLTSRQSQNKRLLDEQTGYRDHDNIVPFGAYLSVYNHQLKQQQQEAV